MEERNKKNKKILLGLALSVIIILVITFLIFYHTKTLAVEIYKNTINEVYTKLDTKLLLLSNIENINTKEDPVNTNLNLKLNTNIEDYAKFNNTELNLSTYIDYKAQEEIIQFDLNNPNETIIKGVLSLLDGKEYLKSNEIFEKTLFLSELDLFNNISPALEINGNDINIEELRYILKSLKDISINSLNKNKIKTTNKTITINTKEYKTTKYTYILDEKNIKRTTKFITNKILNDKELISYLAKLFNMDEDEITKELISIEASIKNSEELKTQTYSIYISGDKVISFEIEEDETLLNFSEVDDYFEFTMTGESYKLKIYKDIDDIKFTFIEKNKELLSGLIKYDDKTFKIETTIYSLGIPLTLTFEIDNIINEEKNTSFDISLGMEMTLFTEMFYLRLDGKCSTGIGETKPDIDVTDAVNINTLTNEELENIMNNFNIILEKFNIDGLTNNN